ncbi:hypothetical protein C5C47_09130 [Rathayibacter rathayi]|nr:hypothetical protein C5C47_09130 [Rathayibacter rathayi]
MNYQERRRRAFRKLHIYLLGVCAFVGLNIVAIIIIPDYSFPQNFFAIWPIVGWGVPTLWRIVELRRYKVGASDA